MLKGPILTIAAAALLAAPLAFAHEQEADHAKTGMQRMTEHMDKMFGAIDADGNGEVTVEEITAHHESRKSKIDTDGDGEISREEMVATYKAKVQQRLDQAFESMDANGDDVISRDEFKPRGGHAKGMRKQHMGSTRGMGTHRGMSGGMGDHSGDAAEMVKRLDANEDGVITRDEFNMAGAMAMGHQRGHGKASEEMKERHKRMMERMERHRDQSQEGDES